MSTTGSPLKQAGLTRKHLTEGLGVVPGPGSEPANPLELSPTPAEPTTAPNGVQYFRVPGWEGIGWLWHGLSSRRGGVSRAYCAEDASGELNLGFTAEDDHSHVLRNRSLLAEAISGLAETPLVTLRQIHSRVIVLSDADSRASDGTAPLCRGDGLVTCTPGLLLAIQTADCIPVLVADLRLRVVAAFHAGWRGTVKRIVETGIGRMRLEFGSQPEDLVAAIGPGIGVCCYQIGEDVQSQFESQFAYAAELFREVDDADPLRTRYPLLFMTQRAPSPSPGAPRLHLDLIAANRRQLLDAGVRADAIHVVPGCTNCHPELFYSYRNSHGRCGRMMSVIGVRPDQTNA